MGRNILHDNERMTVIVTTTVTHLWWMIRQPSIHFILLQASSLLTFGYFSTLRLCKSLSVYKRPIMAARKRKSPRARKSSQKASASAAASKRQRISSSDAVDPQPIIEQEPRKQSITPSGVPDAADEANDCPNKEITTETVVEVAVQNDPFSRPPWETVDHDDRETKLRWMSPIEPIDDHKRVIQERLPKSGRWILEDLRFNTWKDGNESAILWIYGAGVYDFAYIKDVFVLIG